IPQAGGTASRHLSRRDSAARKLTPAGSEKEPVRANRTRLSFPGRRRFSLPGEPSFVLSRKPLFARGAPPRYELALDLYAGVGFFTLPLARRFEKIVAVDANLAATRDLLANADRAGITVESHNQHVEKFLEKADVAPDLIVLDPPRSGLGPHAAAHLAKLGAPEIRYLSCDPSTLARDLAILTGTKAKKTAHAAQASYAITEVHLFDLFPQTFHIETLVCLKRVPSAS